MMTVKDGSTKEGKSKNKMNKRIRHIFALLLTVILTAASCMTVLASAAGNVEIPKSTDTATIKVTDIKESKTAVTATAYKIVEAVYNDNGLTGYQVVDEITAPLSIADLYAPTSDEIYGIAKKIAADSAFAGSLTSYPMQVTGTEASAAVPAGEYIVVLQGAAEVIYNPILLSAYYTVSGSDNTMTGGTISAGTDWTLTGTNGKAKSSEPGITKKITAPADGDAAGKGSDVAQGDAISYEITAEIPSYSDQYTKVKYVITDTMSAGIKPNKDAAVSIDGTAVAENADTYGITYEGQTMTITFVSDYIKANIGKTVKVTYSGTLNDTAALNMDKNINIAEVAYTNDPTYQGDGTPADEAKVAKKNDEAYVYTFALDGAVNGSQTGNNQKTHELIKVDENGNVTDQTFTESMEESTVTNGLAGAEFALIKLNAAGERTDKIYTAITDGNGYFTADAAHTGFTRLDAGNYILVETKAPEGYTLDDQDHRVVIAAVYNEDGTLASYTVTVDGNASRYTATYDANKTITSIVAAETTTTFIQNTRLGELPSTGGIGTYLFTVIGVALMAVAVMLYMRKRRQA